MQSIVKEQFKLVRDRVERGEGNGRWEEVDASGTRDEVEARIWGFVSGIIELKKGPVGRLWMNGE